MNEKNMHGELLSNGQQEKLMDYCGTGIHENGYWDSELWSLEFSKTDTGILQSDALEFSELVRLIMENDCAYSYLIYYFIDWISDQAFEDYAAEEMKKGKSLRQVHAEYFAAWIPWEDCVDKIIERIQELTKDR